VVFCLYMDNNTFDTNLINAQNKIVEIQDPLHLDLNDDNFIEVIDTRIKASKKYYQGKNLYARQDKNVSYYLGDQINTSKLATWQSDLFGHTPYMENIIYEGIRRIKPIATSRLPDLTVKSGSEPENASLLEGLLNTNIKSRENRKLLGLAHVQERLFFYSVIKGRWNKEKGFDGDYEFISIYPKNITWDHLCKTNNADDMMFVAEDAEISLKELIMMFPKKKDELIEKMNFKENDERSQEMKMATKITVSEVWFHWYKDTVDTLTNKTKWEKVHGVVWKYDNLILGKIRNPYYDYEGRPTLFSGEMREKAPMTDTELYEIFATETAPQTIYYNYFKQPRKPYFFMVYESLGDNPISATTAIEQSISFQDFINDEGRQIVEMNERSSGKPIFNSDALDKETVKSIDWRNPKQALSVSGDDVRKAFTFAQLPPASDALYRSKAENRSVGFEIIGINATTRGVREGDQTLGEAQMYREQDFGFIDDLVEDTINEAAIWQAEWSLQFVRLFYTKQHMIDIVGKDGEELHVAITQDLVSNGMIVQVSASAVDKLMRKRMAMETFKLGASDLLSFYEDLGVDNPKERAKRAFMQKSAPMMYFQTYLMDENDDAMVNKLGETATNMPGEDTSMD